MVNLHIDRNGTVPEPPGSDLTIILSRSDRIASVLVSPAEPDLRLLSRGHAEPGTLMRKLDLQRSREAIRNLADRLRSELKGPIPQQLGTRPTI
jgi:hypothetical protein